MVVTVSCAWAYNLSINSPSVMKYVGALRVE